MPHHIGTAGYVYPHWRKGAFYPQGLPQAKELSHYLSNFPSVEINATWHAFPKLTTLQKWRSTAHAQTTFALKAPAVITHEKRLRNAEDDIQAFIKLAREGLRKHLGPILFQCPPSLPLSLALLEQFIATIREAAELYGPLRVALEFRSPDWFCPPVYTLLAEHDIALVNNIAVKDNDFGVLDDLFPHARNVQHPSASWSYNRFHGSKNPGVFTNFPDHILREFVGNETVQFSYFLNDWGAFAPKNAMRYTKLCAEAQGIEVKTLVGGFSPLWTKVRPSIKSFFAPARSHNGDAKSGSLNNVGSLPVVDGGKARGSSTKIMKSPGKNIKSPIQKKRNKRISKDIASFFSGSDKG